MKYSNVYCLKLVIAIALKISLWTVNLMSFDPNRKNKIMSILGRVVPSQRKNRTLLKKTVQMVMLSFWLPNYMEYTCKAWFYQQQQQKKKKKKKKKDHNIFRSIFRRLFHHNFVICWCIQKRYAEKLFHWTDIYIKINRNFDGIQSHMITAMHIYPILKI